MIYLHTKFHAPNCHGSLDIATTLRLAYALLHSLFRIFKRNMTTTYEVLLPHQI